MKGLLGGILGVVALASTVVAQEASEDRNNHNDNGNHGFKPFRFCQLGDIQIGFGLDGWKNDTARMRLAAQQVIAEKFDFCVAVGDLTHNRYDYEVQGFQEVYPEFQGKLHLLPGNHDINSVETLEKFTADYNVSDHTAFSHNGYRFIQLNSVTLMTNLTQFENYTKAEWTWFEEELEEAAKKGEEIIVSHHHLPFEVTEDEADAYWTFPNRIRGRYLDLIRKYNVHHILVGHRHETKNIYATNKDFTIYVVAGTARFFDNNGFGINYFDVQSHDSAVGVTQKYVNLHGAGIMTRSEGLPMGCPDIFAH